MGHGQTGTKMGKPNPSRIDLAIIIPTVTAIVAGLIGFLTSAYVSYLNNNGTLEVEREKERAEAALENQKFKTNLILEAVKTGDRQKALENLTFFIDAGFLDDPDGKIKGLISRNVLPVLPTTQTLATQTLRLAQEAITRGDFNTAVELAERGLQIERASGADPSVLAEKLIGLGDLKTVVFAYPEAIQYYTEALTLLRRLPNSDPKIISDLQAKIEKLKGGRKD